MKLAEVTKQQAKDALAKSKGSTVGDHFKTLEREAREFCELYDPNADLMKTLARAAPGIIVSFTKDGVAEKFIKYLEQLGRGYTWIEGSWTVTARMKPVVPRTSND